MFETRLFGYDRNQVDDELSMLDNKIQGQQRDIDYLRQENLKLKKKIKHTEENEK